MRGRLQLCGGGAQGDRLADANLAGEYAEQSFLDAEVDAGDRLLVSWPSKEVCGGDALAERSVRESEMHDPGGTAHYCCSFLMRSR
jgi:hypothetical protein